MRKALVLQELFPAITNPKPASDVHHYDEAIRDWNTNLRLFKTAGGQPPTGDAQRLAFTKLLPPVMTEPAAENEAPLLTGDHCGSSAENEPPLLTGDQSGSPVASDVVLHTDEEPLVGTLWHHIHHLHCLKQSRMILLHCA